MILEQRQQQVLAQKMMMNQQMLNAVAFLNLSSEEIQEKISKEVKRNPALIFKSSSNAGGAAGAEASDEHQRQIESLEDKSSKSLQESLLKQAGESIQNEFVLDAAKLIIQNLDRNGFNSIPLKELFTELIEQKRFTRVEVKNAIKEVQHLEPIGCASTGVKHSLIIQAGIVCESPKTGEIHEAYKEVYELCTKIIKDHYDLLQGISEDEDVKAFIHRLAKNKIEITEDQAEEIIELVKSLTPFPGRAISNASEAQNFITPVAKILKDGNIYKVILNDDEVPALEISSEYQNSKQSLSKEEKEQISKLVNEAKMFMSVLSFRNQTLLKVLTAIVNIQQNYFAGRTSHINGKKCAGYLKPLKQSDIAEIVDLSVSTISRVANQKYIRCEWGLVEIKKLFSNEVNNGLSKNFVISQMEEIIYSSENKLSDAKISEALKPLGIEISTRTVNKYRKELNIPSSYKR